jgi:hypothetical protein
MNIPSSDYRGGATDRGYPYARSLQRRDPRGCSLSRMAPKKTAAKKSTAKKTKTPKASAPRTTKKKPVAKKP